MKNRVLSLAVAATMAVSGAAAAGQTEEMEKTLQALQTQVAAMQAEIAKMKAAQTEQHEMHTQHTAGIDNVTWGGAIELNMAEGGAGSVATFELEATAQINEDVTGYAKLKAVETTDANADGDSFGDIGLDEVSVTYNTSIAAITVGTGGHPFGDFSTNMISDSMTKNIGDTGGSTKIMVEAPVGENLTITGAVDDDISSIAATYAMGDLAVTAGHISDIKNAGAKSANQIAASYGIGDFSLFAEMIDSDGTADATNIEAAYAFTVAGRDAGVAVGRQETKVMSAEQWNMLSGTVNLAEGLDLVVEHKDSDINTNDAWQAQLNYGF